MTVIENVTKTWNKYIKNSINISNYIKIKIWLKYLAGKVLLGISEPLLSPLVRFPKPVVAGSIPAGTLDFLFPKSRFSGTIPTRGTTFYPKM